MSSFIFNYEKYIQFPIFSFIIFVMIFFKFGHYSLYVLYLYLTFKSIVIVYLFLLDFQKNYLNFLIYNHFLDKKNESINH